MNSQIELLSWSFFFWLVPRSRKVCETIEAKIFVCFSALQGQLEEPYHRWYVRCCRVLFIINFIIHHFQLLDSTRWDLYLRMSCLVSYFLSRCFDLFLHIELFAFHPPLNVFILIGLLSSTIHSKMQLLTTWVASPLYDSSCKRYWRHMVQRKLKTFFWFPSLWEWCIRSRPSLKFTVSSVSQW